MNLLKTLKDVEADRIPEGAQAGRRQMLLRLGMTGVTGAVFYACGSKSDDTATAACSIDKVADAGILNVALHLEQQAVAVYTAAAGLNIWTGGNAPTYKEIAVAFAGHHTKHAADLSATITALGGTPVTAKTTTEYFTANSISNPAALGLADVLKFAMRKELEAAKTYAKSAGKFSDPLNAGLFARLAADESAHYAIFRAAFRFLDSSVTEEELFKAKAPATIIPGSYPEDWGTP